MTRRPHRLPREVLDLFADDGAGTWTIREHSRWRRQGQPAARFVGTMLAWAALTFLVLVLSLHH